jgi:hypothetical protein
MSDSWSKKDKQKEKRLEVFDVGGYQCSLASSPADVLNLDKKVFGDPVGMRSVLEKVNYTSHTHKYVYTPH